jgi:hypothetical protein
MRREKQHSSAAGRWQLAWVKGSFPVFKTRLSARKKRRILIATSFTDHGERAALYALVGMPVPSDDVVKADARSYREDKERGREARFRLTVVRAYNYTCALTGYRLTTIDSGSIVDDARIHQLSDSRNNDPRNGISIVKERPLAFLTNACGRCPTTTGSLWQRIVLMSRARTHSYFGVCKASGFFSRRAAATGRIGLHLTWHSSTSSVASQVATGSRVTTDGFRASLRH